MMLSATGVMPGFRSESSTGETNDVNGAGICGQLPYAERRFQNILPGAGDNQ